MRRCRLLVLILSLPLCRGQWLHNLCVQIRKTIRTAGVANRKSVGTLAALLDTPAGRFALCCALHGQPCGNKSHVEAIAKK